MEEIQSRWDKEKKTRAIRSARKKRNLLFRLGFKKDDEENLIEEEEEEILPTSKAVNWVQVLVLINCAKTVLKDGLALTLIGCPTLPFRPRPRI